MSGRRAIVIGSGLGGLLAAAALARRGWRVTVVERLARPGGKFTAHDHDGFQVPTGAFHAIPYGRRGFLGQALSAAGVRPRLVEQPVGFVVRIGRRRLRPLPGPGPVPRWMPLWTRDLREMWSSRRLAAILLRANRPVSDVRLADLLVQSGAAPQLRRLLAKIAAYGNGLGIDRVSAVEFFASARAAMRWPGAVIRGGCREVIDCLLDRLDRHRVAVKLGVRAERIIVTAGRAQGVVWDGAHHRAERVVSNAGPAETARLLGTDCPAWLRKRVRAGQPAQVIAYAVRSRRSLVPHSCVELPLDAREIAGYIQVTNAAPELAPAGWHLLLALSLFDGQEGPASIEAGKREIRRLFPTLAPDDIFHVSAYQRRYPATETPAAMGSYGSWRYPLKVRGVDGLVMIGHDSVGIGYGAETIGCAATYLGRILEREGETRCRN